MKKKLLPLFAVAVTACGGPEVRHRDLGDISGLRMSVNVADPRYESSQDESIQLTYDRGGPDPDSPCYRLPANTRLTVNGVTVPMQSRGDSSLSFDGVFGCEEPWFSGAKPPMEAERVEYLLTDGRSRKRAVFQNLHVLRSLSGLNGQEQVTLRVGQAVDLEWLPATDQLEEVDLSLWDAQKERLIEIETYQRDGNRIHFTLPAVEVSHYTLNVIGRGQAGVEACEGFSECKADLVRNIKVSVIVE
ncbi:hypothetical protein [Archangium lansingense]|uniref:Lipoprotein n=1 Tax=Archangium lansingense TaxID=2995310 RepID=A0ABT4ANQ0_9BACT|nr:hypothetical protein [Archangium lansinium]MCY1083322.1 hypothetical protein [Archangium lansinium]